MWAPALSSLNLLELNVRPCFLSPRVAAGRRDKLAGSSLCRGCSAAAEDSETLFNVQVTPKSTLLSRLSAVRNGQVEKRELEYNKLGGLCTGCFMDLVYRSVTLVHRQRLAAQ